MKFFLILALVMVAQMAVASVANAANPIVVMKTSMGTVKIELFEEKAPISVKNFLTYVDDKFYDETIFHRVIPNFMIQGGGFNVKGDEKKKTRDPIKNEAANGVANDRGTLAMARTNDPDSATAQFFVNVKDNAFLNRSAQGAGYAVFGRVIEGMDVVDKIKAVKTATNGSNGDWPVEDVKIESIRRADKE